LSEIGIQGGLNLDGVKEGSIPGRGRKTHINLAQNKVHREIQQGKHQTLEGTLRVGQAHGRVSPMINLSFNPRDLAQSLQKNVLERLVELQNLDIVLFQETIGDGRAGIIGYC